MNTNQNDNRFYQDGAEWGAQFFKDVMEKDIPEDMTLEFIQNLNSAYSNPESPDYYLKQVLTMMGLMGEDVNEIFDYLGSTVGSENLSMWVLGLHMGIDVEMDAYNDKQALESEEDLV